MLPVACLDHFQAVQSRQTGSPYLHKFCPDQLRMVMVLGQHSSDYIVAIFPILSQKPGSRRLLDCTAFLSFL